MSCALLCVPKHVHVVWVPVCCMFMLYVHICGLYTHVLCA